MRLLSRFRSNGTHARTTTAPPLPPAEPPRQCEALNRRGRRCGFTAEPGSDYCTIHGQAGTGAA